MNTNTNTKLKTKKEASDTLRLLIAEKAARETIEFRGKVSLAKLFLNSLLNGHNFNDFQFEFYNHHSPNIEVIVRNKINPGFLRKNSLRFTLDFQDDHSSAIVRYGPLENLWAILYFHVDENYATVKEGLEGCEFLIYCYDKLKLS